jgi:hypothetical protein
MNPQVMTEWLHTFGLIAMAYAIWRMSKLFIVRTDQLQNQIDKLERKLEGDKVNDFVGHHPKGG